MKTIKQLFSCLPILGLVCLLLLASCNSDEDIGINSLPIAVQFGSGIAQTKTTNGGNQWTINDPVGIYMIKNGQTLSSGNIAEGANNIEYKAQTGGSNISGFAPVGTNTIYYPQDGSNVDFITYYPYKSPLSNYTYPIDVSNQSTPADIDVLYSNNAIGYNKNSGTVDLQFSHALSKLSFTLIPGNGSPNLTGAKVEITNISTTANIDLATGTVTATNSAQTITANTAPDGLSSSAVMIPISLSTSKLIITLADNVSTFEWLFPATMLLTGKNHQYDITVSKTGITVSSSGITIWEGAGDAATPGTAQQIIYQVGDYYPYPDNPQSAIGIVFTISNGGKNGKMISLDEKIRVSWGPLGVNEQAAGIIGIRDTNDGQAGTKNLIAMRKNDPNFATTYGVFNWIYQTKNNGDINGLWYLPANAELTQFATVYNANQSVFNTKLTTAGHDPIWNDADYRSITEYDNYLAYLLRVGLTYIHLSVDKESTSWGTRARAIRKF